MTALSSKEKVSLTKAWIQDFVIALNLCPFANHPFQKGLIQYHTCDETDARSILEYTWNISQTLLSDKPVSNSFIILDDSISYDDLLSAKDSFEYLLEETGFDVHFQIVAFHPGFHFADESPEHPSNFVNKSPFPMLHILRSHEVELVSSLHENVEDIPHDNKEKLDNLGIDYLRKQLSKYHS